MELSVSARFLGGGLGTGGFFLAICYSTWDNVEIYNVGTLKVDHTGTHLFHTNTHLNHTNIHLATVAPAWGHSNIHLATVAPTIQNSDDSYSRIPGEEFWNIPEFLLFQFQDSRGGILE